MCKSLIIFSAVLACAICAPQYQFPPPSSASDEEPIPYAYQYGVKDIESGDYSAEESSDRQIVSGSYEITLPDGRIQTVTYNVGSDSGYVANVQNKGTPNYPVVLPKYD